MAHITKNNYNIWHQKGTVLKDILSELECSKTKHFRYVFGGTGYDQYRILPWGDLRKCIRLSSRKHGSDIIDELSGHYDNHETIEQKRLKSLRYILAKAYYRLCCEFIQINCLKKDQHEQSLVFAEGGEIDICQYLQNRKEELIIKRKKWKEYKIRKELRNKVNRFQLMDLDEE